MSHYRELGNPEEVSGRIREPRWLRKVQEVWGLCPALTLALSRLRICSWNTEGLFRAVKSDKHKSNASVSWLHKAITHTSNTYGSFISCNFLNAVAPGLTYYSERRWWAHTEISTQTTRCPSGPDSYLLIPAEIDAWYYIELWDSMQCNPINQLRHGQREKKTSLYKYERFHTLLGDLVERKSGCEQ